MRHIHDPHLNRSISVLALNATASGSLEDLDGYLAAGGNALHIHEEGGGMRLRADLGRRLRQRNQTRSLIFCCHVGHDSEDGRSRKDAASLEEDITMHLRLLDIDSLDMVYFDPPRDEAAVREVLETLSANLRVGRIGGYGLRNWTVQQIRHVMKYTTDSKLAPPFAIVTTELSSAVPTRPLWDEYIPFNGPLREASREFDLTVWAWLTDINQPLFVPPDQRSAFMSRERMERWMTEENDRIVSQFSAAAARTGQTLRQANAGALLSEDLRVVGIVSRDAANLADLNEFYKIAE